MTLDTTTFEIGKSRIEALSDGIFAIVMTLLTQGLDRVRENNSNGKQI
jgi:uncharacterized membrane protein